MHFALQSIEELVELIRGRHDNQRLVPIGAQTKPRLSQVAESDTVCIKNLSGITSYEASEFTISALAGTCISEITEALSKHRQYLPFDPMFAQAGATLGGTVASGVSGPGSFRFGGIRDFLLGIRFVTGDGKLVTGGGKVVKNAAGFDLPKFMVGSLGRFGALVELTFKVFPQPEYFCTVRQSCSSCEQAIQLMQQLSKSKWELDAVDYHLPERSLFLRLAGTSAAVKAVAQQILSTSDGDAAILEANRADQFWKTITEFDWAPAESILLKTPTTTKLLPPFLADLQSVADTKINIGSGGAVSWIAVANVDSLASVDEVFFKHRLCGLVLRGVSTKLWLGQQPSRSVDATIKRAFDPTGCFPES